ncbi:MAG: DUF2953 domain-containing protein [Clostridia bacterium]|nr:DUF2953 domain-containing protein [Clostridia bacterium]
MPIPLIVIGGCILFLILLLSLRVRFCIVLRDEVELSLGILCFKIHLFPRKKKIKWKHYSPEKAARIEAKKAKKAAKKEAKRAEKKAKKQKEKQLPPEKKKKSTLADKLRLVRVLAAALIKKTNKHLRLHAARLHLRVATGDAAKTAVLYGVVCQSLSYLLALLDKVTKLKAAEPDVSVYADYLSEKSSADVRLIFSVRLGGVFAIAFSVAFAFIGAKFQQKNKKKPNEKSAASAARAKAQKGHRHG